MKAKNEIVISGMSGKFPDAENIAELSEKLFDKVDLVTDEERRWVADFFNIPKRMGQLKELSKFDNLFFGVHHKLSDDLDPQARILLETTYESIVDAGYDPESLRGRNIGVYIGNCYSDSSSMIDTTCDLDKFNGYGLLGGSQALLANRISYTFDFKGPSFTLDTSCSSGVMALHQAFQAVARGDCDAAVVGAATICLCPEISLAYHRLNMLSEDGKCKSFDVTCDGFVRSEAVVSLFIEKAADAKRNYASIVHMKANTDGYKPEGFTHPSSEMERSLMAEVLEESNLTPDKISYVEAHAAGSAAGDRAELSAITNVFCSDRDEPLLVGSIKSNIGHTEPCSGICGIMKILIGLEKGMLPPNLHFNEPVCEEKFFADGKIKVVTEPTPWDGEYAAFNCFGYGGVNVHGILKRNPVVLQTIDKIDNSIPQIILNCGRTKESIETIFNSSVIEQASREFFALLHQCAYTPAKKKPYRSFKLLGVDENNEDVQLVPVERRPVWYVFSGMGTQWPAMAKDLMKIDICAKSIKKSAEILKPYIDDLEGMITQELKSDTPDDSGEKKRVIIPAFVSIAAVQIALVDLLNELGLKPDGIVGHSVGELGCAYADGCFTAEQMLLAAYWRGKATEDSDLIQGAMAAVGMTWEDAVKRCPEGVYAACHNGEDSVTISGPRDKVRDFISELKAENIFAREVNACGYAFHCVYVSPIAERLQAPMERVIPDPKPRSERWISSSFPEEKWNEPETQMADASYFVHNLVSPVLFYDALSHVPKTAIVIEIGPHHLLQAILKREIGTDAVHVGLMKRNTDNVIHILSSMGKLYSAGLDPDIEKLYPPVPFPVPRNTPMISPLIGWDHSETWKVNKWSKEIMACEFPHEIEPGPITSSDHFLLDYVIDGCHIFPPAGYLVLVWKSFTKVKLVQNLNMLPVAFENVTFIKQTVLSETGKKKLTVDFFKTNGAFEISENGVIVCKGFLTTPDDTGKNCLTSDVSVDKEDLTLNMKDIYKELRLRGYQYGPEFQGIMAANFSGSEGIIKWNENWVVHLDSMLQFLLLSDDKRSFVFPTRIQTLTIDPVEHRKLVEKAINEYDGIPVKYDSETEELFFAGVYIKRMKVDLQKKNPDKQLPLLEEYKFVPYKGASFLSKAETEKCKEYITVCSSMSKKILSESCKWNKLSGKQKEEIKSLMDTLKVNDDLMEKYSLKSEENGYILLRHLSNILKKSDKENIKECVSKYLNESENDLLSQILLNEPTLRTTTDVIMENMASRKMKIVEITDGYSSISSKIHEYISLSSMMNTSYSILHPETELLNQNTLPPKAKLMNWKNKPSLDFEDVDLFIFTKLKSSAEEIKSILKNASMCLKDEGFILLLVKNRLIPAEVILSTVSEISIPSIKEKDLESVVNEMNLNIVCKKFDTLTSTLYLLRKSQIPLYKDSIIRVTAGEYTQWVDKLKDRMIESQKSQDSSYPERLWLISEGSRQNGVIGLVNCLRKELGGSNIRCVFIDKKEPTIPQFDLKDPFYKEQLDKNLVMNVFQNKLWGSYRHISCKNASPIIKTEHAYLNILKTGDLSSFAWIDSSKKDITLINSCADNKLCHVYYASLNFRDVMLASGKLSLKAYPSALGFKDSFLGIEFSGRTSEGRRVMGIVSHKAMATTVIANRTLLWDVPDEWSLEQAATVPVAYATAYYALIYRGHLKKGESVLIHSGSGGVGQAAIHIALSMGCNVYTTVGTEEKKKFLKNKFPQLMEEQIYSSRDTTFEQHIMHTTNGKGVYVILNSLAEDKLTASLNCIAINGRFLQIGKLDVANNRNLGMSVFLKNVSFDGILLDKLFDKKKKSQQTKLEVFNLLKKGISDGVVKPLNTTVFSKDEAEQAFKYMASANHTGKIVFKIREEEKERKTIPSAVQIDAIVRTTFDPEKSYVIIGGLEGIGLELCHWLIDRGAKNIVLSSRSAITTGYQKLCLHRWEKESIKIVTSKLNAAKKEEAKDMLKLAIKLGPVGGIFNLSMVLRNGFMENQTAQNFKDVCESKVETTRIMDLLSREFCPELDWFVCFSSYAAGQGIAGRSCYGFANSAMERICEDRVCTGLPALAIQWGAIEDVDSGQSAVESDIDLSGTLPQPINSCLTVLDEFIQQHHPVVSSFVPYRLDKVIAKIEKEGFMAYVTKLLGIADISSINPEANLSELGMDFLAGMKLKDILEFNYDIPMSLSELQKLKVKDLKFLTSQAY